MTPLETDMTTENNKLTMQRFTEFINTASEKLAAELISPNAVFHVPGRSEPMRAPAGYLAIIGMIVAEFFTAINGLGGLIVAYSNTFATAKLFVPIIVLGLFGVGLTELVARLERRLSRWRISERDRF